MYMPTDVVTSVEQVREVIGDILFSQDVKVIDHIDMHCQSWVEHSTFVVVSSARKSGNVDVGSVHPLHRFDL